MNDYTLKLIIEAQDKFSKELSGLKGQLDDVQKQAKKTSEKASNVFDSIKKGMVRLGLGAAIYKTTASVINLGKQIEPIRNSFIRLSESVGIAGDEMLQAMRKASAGTVSDYKLMESANTAYSLGVVKNIDEMTTLMEIARLKGQAMGRTMEEALSDIVRGLGRASPMILDNLGIVVKQGEAQEKYAQSIGKTVEQLTEAEKKQALVNAVVEQGKKELEEAGEIPLTFQDGINQVQTALQNLGADIGSRLLPQIKEYSNKIGGRIEGNREVIIETCDEIFDTVKTVVDNLIKSGVEVYGVIEEIRNQVAEGFNILMGMIGTDNAETTNGIMGDWSDLFYFLKLGFTAVVQGAKTAIVAIVSYSSALVNSIGDIAGNIGDVFSALWADVKNGALSMAESCVNSVVKLVNGVIEKMNRLVKQMNKIPGVDIGELNKVNEVDFGGKETGKLKEQLANLSNSISANFEEATKKTTDAFNNGMQAMLDVYENRIKKTTQEAKKITEFGANKIGGSFGNYLEELDNSLSGGGSGKKSAKNTIDENTEALEALQKEMSEYARETMEMKKATYDGIVDSMEAAVKSAEKLSNDIAKLKEDLSELGVNETKDVAGAYLKAQDRLSEMAEEYSNIAEIVQGMTKASLGGYKKDDVIGGISVEDLREYIDLQEQLASAYAGLSDEETKALDEQIQKQKEYNELNDIEKIKYDYAQKRQALEADIQEKETLLQKELDAFKASYESKVDYESKWLQYMNYSYKEQMKMQETLMDQLQRIIALKAEAGMGGIAGAKAGGGMVYGGNAYLVGEHGPELFVPSQRGSIVPNNQITNNNGVEINISGVSVRSDNDINEIANEIVRRIKLEKEFGIA